MIHRYCQHHGIVPATHNCGRWQGGSTRTWRRTRALVLQAQPICTTPGCNQPSDEVHHVTDAQLRAVCHTHNPRGG